MTYEAIYDDGPTVEFDATTQEFEAALARWAKDQYSYSYRPDALAIGENAVRLLKLRALRPMRATPTTRGDVTQGDAS